MQVVVPAPKVPSPSSIPVSGGVSGVSGTTSPTLTPVTVPAADSPTTAAAAPVAGPVPAGGRRRSSAHRHARH